MTLGVAKPRVAALFGWPLLPDVGAERFLILGAVSTLGEHLFEGDQDFGDPD